MKRTWTHLILALLAIALLTLGASLVLGEQTPASTAEDPIPAVGLASAIQVDLGQQQGEYLITKGGTYVLTGTLNGRLTIQAGEEDLVRLVLSNASILCADGPAICGLQADKVILTLEEGTQNRVSDGKEYTPDEEGANAAVYMKTDLTINGTGVLEVSGQTAHGILSKDKLLILSGSLAVTSVKDGLRGKEGVDIQGGNLHIQAGSDGIVSTGTGDGEGSVQISGGAFVLVAGRDGIQAESSLTVTGGSFDIRTGEGGSQVQAAVQNLAPQAVQASAQTDAVSSATRQQQGARPQAGLPQPGIPRQGEWAPEAASWSSEESLKGLKAGVSLSISGGTFSLDTADDALHSNGDLTISGGRFTILTGDDGVHAAKNLRVLSGDISITGCYEGLEGKTVTIDGGNITITASDDGINAADSALGTGGMGRGDMSVQEGVWVTISGGTVRVTAGYDGIDSNGSITISGGTADLTSLRAGGGNAAIDPNGTYTHTAGTVTTNDGSENGMAGGPGGRPGFPGPGRRH